MSCCKASEWNREQLTMRRDYLVLLSRRPQIKDLTLPLARYRRDLKNAWSLKQSISLQH